nr:Abi-alpha family protein [Asticcacaulis aquaticus]
MIGEPLKDLAGLMGADWLKQVRADRIAEMSRDSQARLAARGVTQTVPVSLSVALPLLEGAADEGRTELKDVWARLLAAARDPNRSAKVSRYFINAIKKLEPLDALVLSQMTNNFDKSDLDNAIKLDSTAVDTSLANLYDIGLVYEINTAPPISHFRKPRPTPRGRELLKLLAD